VDSIVETARLAGITSKLDPNLSLALGSSAVSPIDMATAYATFARFGVMTTPQVIRRIENNKGQVIEVFETKSDKVFPVEPVARLVDVLQDVIKYGTGTMARLDDRPVAGKTGTADAAKDIWFIGFTPDMVTALWAGNDENLPIPGSHVTGGSVMAKIWKEYAKAYYEAHPTPPGSFIAPTALAKSDIPTVDQDASPMVLPGLNGVNPQLPPDALPKNEPTAPFTSAPTPGADGMPPTAPSITPQATPNSEAISVSPGAIKRDTPKPAPDFRSSPSSTTIMPDTSNSSTSNGSSGTSGVSSRRYYPYNQQTKYLPAQPASAPSPN
jgi:penicillin-binding protein 1A